MKKENILIKIGANILVTSATFILSVTPFLIISFAKLEWQPISWVFVRGTCAIVFLIMCILAIFIPVED